MTEIPYAIALSAGVLAVLNPCGFALLPAYLALLVARGEGAGERSDPPWRVVGRALATTAALTGGFVTVFGAFALVAVPLALRVERHLPVVTIVIGLVLVLLGGWLLAGRRLGITLPAPRLGGPRRSLRWVFGYGVAYAIASLSCTVAPFLGVTASAVGLGGPVAAVGVFLTYAAGTALVIGIVTVATALARDGVIVRLRGALPYVTRVGGALLVVAGAYVAYYGWFELRVLAGGAEAENDPIVGTALRIQSTLNLSLFSLGPAWLAVVLAVLMVAGGALVFVRRRLARPTRGSVPAAAADLEDRSPEA
ncbi:cytochrome c biogenesis protein CcdA [Nocardiopsis sp. Huas11]|uniref:cytochrome c biogenesis protein CcdA n=1 Tax=Nocardiopsis sp. Huas11 TaxID=2183912 RepID=UPI000EB364E2|nr:cytochrome c biogenesis protein CcdA [Nocardiopsis sp. Huas11]RKS05825.1 cytochrome c biogenesis protein CcdA [Nocardiopsis sp. Huas11]